MLGDFKVGWVEAESCSLSRLMLTVAMASARLEGSKRDLKDRKTTAVRHGGYT